MPNGIGMKQDLFALDETYSTTRLITRQKPVIENNSQNKFKTMLFLPEAEGRNGEGGLRTQGYFKKSLPEKPLITIITVVFNGKKYLEETIQSVINQTYDNVEYIIIDGASTDGTVDIIKKYEGQIDYWVSEGDGGIYDAMNKGIGIATGEIIGILNSDDWYELDAVQNVLNVFLQGKSDVVYGNLILIYNDIGLTKISAPTIDIMKKTGTINHQAVFVKNSIYKEYLFNLNYRIVADYDLIVKLIKNGYVFNYCNELIAYMRAGGASGSVFTILERYKVQKKYFGLVYAMKILFTQCFYFLRRSAVKIILPSPMYEAIRKRWLIYRFGDEAKHYDIAT